MAVCFFPVVAVAWVMQKVVTRLLSGWDEGGEYGDVLRTAGGLEQMSQALGVEVQVSASSRRGSLAAVIHDKSYLKLGVGYREIEAMRENKKETRG